ncbi:MAG TPA: hypothetical protein VGL56_14945 [Fimbriimonadaceae bacterium]|jgi:hypothetical protein
MLKSNPPENPDSPLNNASELRHLVDSIDHIGNIAQHIKMLAVAIFGLGAWVAYQTFNLNDVQMRVRAMESDNATNRAEWRAWRERVDDELAATRADVAWIRDTVARDSRKP